MPNEDNSSTQSQPNSQAQSQTASEQTPLANNQQTSIQDMNPILPQPRMVLEFNEEYLRKDTNSKEK